VTDNDKTLAYYDTAKITAVKSFYGTASLVNTTFNITF